MIVIIPFTIPAFIMVILDDFYFTQLKVCPLASLFSYTQCFIILRIVFQNKFNQVCLIWHLGFHILFTSLNLFTLEVDFRGWYY